jgi:hypothetical protein
MLSPFFEKCEFLNIKATLFFISVCSRAPAHIKLIDHRIIFSYVRAAFALMSEG